MLIGVIIGSLRFPLHQENYRSSFQFEQDRVEAETRRFLDLYAEVRKAAEQCPEFRAWLEVPGNNSTGLNFTEPIYTTMWTPSNDAYTCTSDVTEKHHTTEV